MLAQSIPPASSNPAEIIERLRAATDSKRPDWHEPSIATWKLQMQALATEWEASGRIDAAARTEIFICWTGLKSSSGGL